jgi:hypothetical protein
MPSGVLNTTGTTIGPKRFNVRSLSLKNTPYLKVLRKLPQMMIGRDVYPLYMRSGMTTDLRHGWWQMDVLVGNGQPWMGICDHMANMRSI